MRMRRINKRTIANAALSLILVASTVAAGILLFAAPDGDDFAEAASVRQGSRGDVVKKIQTKLKNWGYYSGKVDGIFGPKTTSAVKRFQRKNGLTADGIVGANTAKAMGLNLSGTRATSGGNDVYLLARLVYGEARGEPYTGQVAVASVVLNRVKSSSFPNTISGVIYQAGAFSVVSDGQINLTPDNTALRAARDAMNGWDPTYGCLYYYNPRTATNAWIRRKPIHLAIGRHVFCL